MRLAVWKPTQFRNTAEWGNFCTGFFFLQMTKGKIHVHIFTIHYLCFCLIPTFNYMWILIRKILKKQNYQLSGPTSLKSSATGPWYGLDLRDIISTVYHSLYRRNIQNGELFQIYVLFFHSSTFTGKVVKFKTA